MQGWSKVPDDSGDTFILCRSANRREKEAAMHERFERKMEDGLKRLSSPLQTPGLVRNLFAHGGREQHRQCPNRFHASPQSSGRPT